MEIQIKALARNRYLELIIGFLFIAITEGVFITPAATYTVLSIVFAITFLIIGVTKTLFAFSNRKYTEGRELYFAGGFVDVLVGLLLLSTPSFTFSLLPNYIGYAMLFRSALAIGLSFKFQRLKISDWRPMLIFGISCFVMAFIMLWNPVISGLTIESYTATVFLINGIFHVILTVGLKKLYKEFKMKGIMSLNDNS